MHVNSVRSVAALLALLVALVAPGAAATAAPAGNALDRPGAVLPANVPPPPAVAASTWLVADLGTGEVLAAQGAHVRLAPASTIKVLTALALAPYVAPDDTWTATHEDAAIEGSRVGLVPGSVYRGSDLMHGLLLGSGNDAASALAGMVGGMDVATAHLQETADGLGMHDTSVRNTSGLDADGQFSSAFDLALLGRAGLRDPRVAALVGTQRYAFPGVGTTFGPERPTFEIANHNRLLFGYEGTLGIKNGYTVAAGGSFVGAVERGGHRYVVTLLTAEGQTWRLARDLLDWAIAHGQTAAPVGTLDPRDPPSASGWSNRIAGDVDDVPAAALVTKRPDVAGPAPAAGAVRLESPAASSPIWLDAAVAAAVLLALIAAAQAARASLPRR